MSQNEAIIKALDSVLTSTVWLSENNQIVSLADELHIAKNDGTPRSIEDLNHHSLIGALLSLQIRSDNFDISADSLSDKELGLKVKQLVFSETQKIIASNNQSSLRVA